MASPFDALHIPCEERDQRFLMGGNFFGSELVAPPPLEPLPIDFAPPELPVAEGPSGSSSTPPPLLIKLPTGKKS